MGIPANAIAEAVFARCLSALKEERVAAAQGAQGPARTAVPRRPQTKLIDAIRDALYCSKICAYAQGFQLMREAQKEYKWKLELRRDRRDLARRLHHPRALPAEDHRRLHA